VLTETVGAGTWRGPGADADLARFVDAFSALLATEEEPSGIGGGPIGRIRKEVLTSESGRGGPYREASRRPPRNAPAPGLRAEVTRGHASPAHRAREGRPSCRSALAGRPRVLSRPP